ASSCGASVGGRVAAEGDVRDAGRDKGKDHERPRDGGGHALPVPGWIEPEQVARRRIEEEVAMREERFVKKQEERIERERRRGAGQGDGARRDQRTVAHQPEGAPLAPCAVEAEGGDGEREEPRELRAGEDVSDVSHV